MTRSQPIFKKFYQRKLNKSHLSLFQAQIRPMDIMGLVTGNLRVHCIKTALFEDTFLDNNRAIISSCHVCFAFDTLKAYYVCIQILGSQKNYRAFYFTTSK